MWRFANPFMALLGGLLLWMAWPVSPLTFLVFVAWMPLLWIEDRISGWLPFLGLTYLHMFIWNISVTWWVWNASLPGALSAFLANSLIMCIPWLLFYFTKRNLGSRIGYISLIAYWLVFEFIHHNWELSWPWLTLGNAFATHPEWVQWYQYTGSAGGSLWIMLANIIAWSMITEFRERGRTKKYFVSLAFFIGTIVLPVLGSRWMIEGEKSRITASMAKASRNIVIVQPNVDPYYEKFTGTAELQIQKLIALSEEKITPQTSLVIWPETAIPVSVNEESFKDNYFYAPIWSFLSRHPFVSLLSGINSYKVYGKDKSLASRTARFDSESGLYYDEFNTAAFIESDTTIQLYHKAKLVPGVETLPSFLQFMGKWFEELGGISGTLGRDSERKVFVAWDQYYKAAPVICYESIYSDYLTEFIRRGANVIAVITNDGWWENTPGYKQHMQYARLRAVETRKWIARSANTGISCFIDPVGNVINPQPWDIASATALDVPVDNRVTFFVRHGDLLSRVVLVLGILMLAGTIWVVAWRKMKM